MEIISRKDGYGYLVKWLINLSDIFITNVFFFALCIFATKILDYHIPLTKSSLAQILLLVNLSYFITGSIINVNLASNILFFDKVIQKSISFISLFMLMLIVGATFLGILDFSYLTWLGIYTTLCLVRSIWHIIIRISIKLYRKKGFNYKRVVVVGGGINGINVCTELSSSVYGYKVLGYFDDNPQPNKDLPSYLGSISEVNTFCIDNDVKEIYCTLPGGQECKILNLMNFSERNLIRFYLVPEFYKYIKRRLVLSSLHTIPVVALRKEPLQSLHNRALKRMFDIAFSSIVLVTIFPIIYLIFGAIIKTSSSGPVFFTQKRTGQEGRNFDCYKFRSMKVNKEADSLATVKCDPRVTRVGAFMRKTSIDELPQFINVFLGNMSVVGPRPHMIQQTELYLGLIEKFMVRHFAKPGITGWAQVTGYRGETETISQMEGRFKRDVWYIENWTFVLDIKIIFVTVLNMFRGEEKAY